MASQPLAASSVVEIESYVRGFHAYQDVWHPTVGEILALRKESTNEKDSLAVSVVKDDNTLGHMPYDLAPLVFYFLSREVNKGLVETTGEKVNRGAGMGLELPCIYRLYGPRRYLDRLVVMLGDAAAPARLQQRTSAEY